MQTIVGTTLVYGDNINTDIISPPQYMELSIAEASQYAMQALDPDFAQRVEPGKILVAGANFGSGSSRETSPLTLKYLGIAAIVAKFFARIFYRNAINVGIPVVECAEADRISEGDRIKLLLEEGFIQNLTKNESYACTPIPEHILEIINNGGLVDMMKRQYAKGREE